MDFIWIYIESPSYWHKSGIFNELEYSVKSVLKNFHGEKRLFIVGDKPHFSVDLPIIHVPCERIESSKYGYYRHFDMIKKVLTGINHANCEEFVLMYDDIYFLKPVLKSDLEKAYVRCKIEDLDAYGNSRPGDNGYRNIWINTYNRILEFREDLYDYETHMPKYFKTIPLLDIINRFRLNRVPYLVGSLYNAINYPEVTILTDEIQSNIIRDTPLHNNYEKDFSAQFMNISDDGISQEVRKRFKDLFD